MLTPQLKLFSSGKLIFFKNKITVSRGVMKFLRRWKNLISYLINCGAALNRLLKAQLLVSVDNTVVSVRALVDYHRPFRHWILIQSGLERISIRRSHTILSLQVKVNNSVEKLNSLFLPPVFCLSLSFLSAVNILVTLLTWHFPREIVRLPFPRRTASYSCIKDLERSWGFLGRVRA